MVFLKILYSLAIMGCFLLMPHTTKARRSLRKIKLVFLWTILFLIVTSMFKATYICHWLSLMASFTGLIVVANVPFSALSPLKKGVFLLNYIVLVIILLKLFAYAWHHLML